MVVEVFMVLKHLSMCWKFWSCSCFIYPFLLLCASLIYFLTRFLCIESALDLNVFWICFLMLSLNQFIFSMWASSQTIKPNLKALKKSTCWEITQEFYWVLEVITSLMNSSYPFCFLFVPRMTSNEREVRFGELLSRNRFLSSTKKNCEETL